MVVRTVEGRTDTGTSGEGLSTGGSWQSINRVLLYKWWGGP